MSEDWKAGDIAVCVDAAPGREWAQYLGDPGYTRPLVEGRHYRVEAVKGSECDSSFPMLKLEGIQTNYLATAWPGFDGFWPHPRFRKLNDEPDDIEFIERIKGKKPATSPVQQEQEA